MLVFNALCYFPGKANIFHAVSSLIFYSRPLLFSLFTGETGTPQTNTWKCLSCSHWRLGLNFVAQRRKFLLLLLLFFPSSFIVWFFFFSLQFFGDHSDLGCLEQGFVTTESLKIEEEAAHFSNSMFEDKMPFLQMLQSVGSPHFLPFKEPSFQTLLRLQHLKKPCEVYTYFPGMDTQIQALELESCVTNDIVELHSPMKSETMDIQHPHSASCLEATVSSECNQEKPNSAEKHCIESNSGSPPPWANPQSWPKHTQFSKSLPIVSRERKKRKRARPTKNKEEVENQRMTHIAVERNRRRQMNDHLNVLRSLMPASYIQRVILYH